MSGTPEINVLRKVGVAVTGLAKRNLDGESNPSPLDVSDRRPTKSRSISRRGFVQGTIGLVAGAVAANFLPRQGFAQTEDDAAADGPPIPPRPADSQPPQGSSADGSVEAAVPVTGDQVVPVEDADTVVVPPNAGVGEPPVEAVDIREAPANASIDLSPKHIEEVMQTIKPPTFLGGYPGKDTRHEADATRIWLWYQAVAQIHGGQVAKSAKELETRVNGGLVRKIGNVGVVSTALIAPNDLSDWPAITNTSINIQHIKRVEKLDNQTFQLRNLIVIESLDSPKPTDIGAIAQCILLPNERTDIVGRVAGDLVGKQGVNDPEQLRILIKDTKSEPNIRITTWSWRTVLGQVNALLEESPDRWTMSDSFRDFYKGYVDIRDDPAKVDEYIINYYHLK